MHSPREIAAALSLVWTGCTDVEASRRTGIPRSTIRDWRHGRLPGLRGWPPSGCPICVPGAQVLPAREYAYVLGMYLGDGCVSRHPRAYRLRIFCDAAYPGIVEECRRCLAVIRPGNRAWVSRRKDCRCDVIAMYSQHWPCLLPQMGPGRKHNRKIRLESWQQEIVANERVARSFAA
jgi:hypothetical protein